MKTIIFDTEGTGDKTDQLCQIAYIIRDGDNHDAKNFFFTVDSMNPYALKVHGLSRLKLEQLSGGERFKDRCEELCADFSAADIIVGHNVKSDIKRLDGEFWRLGTHWSPKAVLCTMQYFNNALQLNGVLGQKKYPRLSELCGYYNVADDVVLNMCHILFNAAGISNHDARFDASATYLCLLAAKRVGDIRMVF